MHKSKCFLPSFRFLLSFLPLPSFLSTPSEAAELSIDYLAESNNNLKKNESIILFQYSLEKNKERLYTCTIKMPRHYVVWKKTKTRSLCLFKMGSEMTSSIFDIFLHIYIYKLICSSGMRPKLMHFRKELSHWKHLEGKDHSMEI